MQRKVQETCGFTNVTNVYGGIQLKCQKNRKHQKSIRLCGCILIAAFFIVLLSGKLPEVARRRQVRESDRQKQTYNNTYEKDVSKKQTDNTKIAKKNPKIRVLLMTTGYTRALHTEVKVSGKEGLILRIGAKKVSVPAGKTVTIKASNRRLKKHTIKIRARKGTVQVKSIRRGYGTPSYSGTLELKSAGKKIALINELTVEDYLCAVVPSEMPVSYKLEALKAQAVCARSYAYRQMENYAYPKYRAHVNDSTDYQVYGNSKQADSAVKAVRQTAGETAKYKGKIATTYYYSTSSGRTTTTAAWGSTSSAATGYLKSVSVCGKNGDYEKNLPWYRWTVDVTAARLSTILYKNTGKDVGSIRKIYISKRGPGKVALELKVKGDKGNLTIKTENKIRSALAGDYDIRKQDGSKVKFRTLLPSAFITITKKKSQIHIRGGGFGHGIGMSQTGANEMAKQGKTYKEILKLFYSDITVEN